MLDKKNGFPKWLLINRGYAKKIINPGGPPVFKLQKKIGKFLLINRVVLLILTWHYMGPFRGC